MDGQQEQPTINSFREALFNNAPEAYEPLSGKRYLRIDPPKDGVLTDKLITQYLKDNPLPGEIYHDQPIYVIASLKDQARMYRIIYDHDASRIYAHDFDREGRGYAIIGERQNVLGSWNDSDTIPNIQGVWLPEDHYFFCLVSQLPPALLERINNDETVTVQETLRAYNKACPYLKEVLTCPIAKLQERLARLDRLAKKYKTYPPTKLRDLGMNKYHSYWLAEQEELTALINYRENLARKDLLSSKPDEMEKACLEISLDNLAEEKEETGKLTFTQAFWLDELLVKSGQKIYEKVQNPKRILERLQEESSQYNLRPGDLKRERELAEDLEDKLKVIEKVKRRYFERRRRTQINFSDIKQAVIKEERERQAAEVKEAPESTQQPSQPSAMEQAITVEITNIGTQIQQLEEFGKRTNLPEAIILQKIEELRKKRTRTEQRLAAIRVRQAGK